MIRLKIFRKGKVAGGSLTILWLLQLGLTVNTHAGGHVTVSLCLGPVEASIGITLWDSWLPE